MKTTMTKTMMITPDPTIVAARMIVDALDRLADAVNRLVDALDRSIDRASASDWVAIGTMICVFVLILGLGLGLRVLARERVVRRRGGG
jgi:hypothetical protein